MRVRKRVVGRRRVVQAWLLYATVEEEELEVDEEAEGDTCTGVSS